MRLLSVLVLMVVAAAGCAPPAAPSPTDHNQVQDARRRSKTITIGLIGNVRAFSIMSDISTTGGAASVADIHSAPLVTSDVQSRKPVGRLAESVPTLEDGSITVLPDGRMRVVYRLRKGITWQDGTPLTADDLVFSVSVNNDENLPNPSRDAARRIGAAETLDQNTAAFYFREPYYLAGSLGLRYWWPHPRHLLGAAYEQYQSTKDPTLFLNLPYWTSEYVHLGPFRLTQWDPNLGMDFEAYDGYFLGRPKADFVRIRVFAEGNGLYANLLAGSVDVFMESSLRADLGADLTSRWQGSGEGSAYGVQAGHRFITPQWRPNVQTEPANLDPRVRAALYRALDRDALAETLQYNRSLAAYELLPPAHRYFAATKDAFRPYTYDLTRARANFADVGWKTGPDGVLRNDADGRTYKITIWAVDGVDKEVAAFADYWRRVGVDVEEFTIPAAQVRNNEYRAFYPSWEAAGNGAGEGILTRLDGPAANPQNRWIGNRGGYDDPMMEQLLDAYRGSLAESDQFQRMKAISDFAAQTLPLLVIFGSADYVGVRRGVVALSDIDGGDGGGQPYGTYTRNAHLWDVE